MLARTPPKQQTPKTVDFAELLRIPTKPASLVEAETIVSKATTERESAQSVQAHALWQFRSMAPGQIPTITAREVDELGVALTEKVEAEATALAIRDAERSAFDASIRAQLDVGLDALREELLSVANRLDDLISHGVALHAEAAAARLNLHDRLPLRCREMKSTVAFIRRSASNG